MGFDGALGLEAKHVTEKQTHPRRSHGTAAVPFSRSVGDRAYVLGPITFFARYGPLLLGIFAARMYEKDMGRKLSCLYEPV